MNKETKSRIHNITGKAALKFWKWSLGTEGKKKNNEIWLKYLEKINTGLKSKSMAMCGNHIQRAKIVINDNIIEEITDFKYLGYRISEYKSDLEDKLQTYNKINGAIRRHFGKQMNKETKSRIHNITAKAALKFWKWSLGTEEKRGTTFRSSTDEIFETLSGDNKIG